MLHGRFQFTKIKQKQETAFFVLNSAFTSPDVGNGCVKSEEVPYAEIKV